MIVLLIVLFQKQVLLPRILASIRRLVFAALGGAVCIGPGVLVRPATVVLSDQWRLDRRGSDERFYPNEFGSVM